MAGGMLLDVPVHDLSAGHASLLQDSRNKSGTSSTSASHLKCNLRLRFGARHLLLGKNGCGKTTLLRAVHAGLPGARQIKTFLVDQELKLLSQSETVMQAVLSADEEHAKLLRRCQQLEASEICLDANEVAELKEIYDRLAQEEEDSVRERRAKCILEGLGFSQKMMDGCMEELSGGWRMRAAIACALFFEPELLLLDEPTNHLDLEAILWLQDHLVAHYSGSTGRTLLCVSHDRTFINAVLTDIIAFQDKALSNFHGTLEDFEIAAEQLQLHLQREGEELEKKRVSAQSAIDSHVAREARSMKNKESNIEHRKYADGQGCLYGAGQSSKVKALNRKLERVGMEKTLDGRRFKASEHGFRLGSIDDNEGESKSRALAAAPVFQKTDPFVRFCFAAPGDAGVSADMPIVQFRNVRFAYPGEHEPVLDNVEVSISARSRVVITGANGAGKTTLVNLIIGKLEASSGEVWRHHSLKVGYLSQHETDTLRDLEATPLEYISACFPSLKELSVRSLLGQFGVQGSMAMQSLSSLSGGQRVRVALAKLNAEKPQLLILDEPTNHLDIYSVDTLTDELKKYQGSIVLVTHSRSMLQNIAEKVIVVKQGTCSESRLDGQSPATWLQRAVFGCRPVQESIGFGKLRSSEKAGNPKAKMGGHHRQDHERPQGVLLGRVATVRPKGCSSTGKTLIHSVISALDQSSNMSRLLAKLQDCDLSSDEDLGLLAQELSKRVARAQQREVPMFADLCVEFNAWCVKTKIGSEPEKSFKRKLLEACQGTFGRCLEDSQRVALQNCTQLMGCLIARGLVAGPVIFPVAEELLHHASSESLQSLAAFLQEAAPKFDQTWKHHNKLLEVLEKVRVLSEDNSQPARIRQQLQDVFDQRSKGWRS